MNGEEAIPIDLSIRRRHQSLLSVGGQNCVHFIDDVASIVSISRDPSNQRRDPEIPETFIGHRFGFTNEVNERREPPVAKTKSLTRHIYISKNATIHVRSPVSDSRYPMGTDRLKRSLLDERYRQ